MCPTSALRQARRNREEIIVLSTPPSTSASAERVRRPTRRPARLAGWLIRGILRFLSWLPLHQARRIAGWAAALAWTVGHSGKRISLANLAHSQPQLDSAAQRRLAREAATQTAWLFAEQGAVWYWPRERWAPLINDSHTRSLLLSTIRDAASDEIGDGQQGTLLLVPHLGNWELLSLYLGEFDLTALYDPPRLMSLDAPIRRARERSGSTLLPIDRRGLRGLLSALDDGGVVALLPDQVPDRRAGVYAPFFGQPALTMTLAHRLIQRTRPAVLMAAVLRTSEGFELKLKPMDDAIADPDPVVSAGVMNAAIEQLIELAPNQYQWSYKRFKRPPPGVAKLYKSGS